MPPGNRYVEVANTTDEAKPFSGLLAFELQDAENRTYDPTFSGHEPAMPDGELAPNGGKRGLAVFQVPEVMSARRLNFDSKVFGTGTATVNLSSPSSPALPGPRQFRAKRFVRGEGPILFRDGNAGERRRRPNSCSRRFTSAPYR